MWNISDNQLIFESTNFSYVLTKLKLIVDTVRDSISNPDAYSILQHNTGKTWDDHISDVFKTSYCMCWVNDRFIRVVNTRKTYFDDIDPWGVFESVIEADYNTNTLPVHVECLSNDIIKITSPTESLYIFINESSYKNNGYKTLLNDSINTMSPNDLYESVLAQSIKEELSFGKTSELFNIRGIKTSLTDDEIDSLFESKNHESSETVCDLVQKIKSLIKDRTESSQALAYDHIFKLQDLVYGMCIIEPSLYKIFIYKQHAAGLYYYHIDHSNSIELYKGNSNIIEITTKKSDRYSIFYLFLTESAYKNNIFDIVFDNTYFKDHFEIEIGKFIVDESEKHGLQLKTSDILRYSPSTSGIEYDDSILSEVDDLFESKNNMKTFKQFFNESFEIGLEEQIKIPELGLVIPAKIDSGNDAYNVLHGENIQINGNQASFTTIKGKQITKPLKDTITINVGAGNTENRPVVCFDIILGNKKFKNVPFSIGNRADNEYPILVGKPFISKIGALINVRKKNTL